MSDENDETDLVDIESREDLPKVDVEFTIDVPKEIEELARERHERAKDDDKIPGSVTFEDYLMDHIDLDWSFNLEDDDG